MPSGPIHAKATLVLAVAGGILAYRHGYPLSQVIALTGGTLSGLVLTPDLDVNTGCISNAVVRRSTGRPFEWLWRLYWRPYSQLIPHRSRLSHLPVLGTALRLFYLCILPAMAWWLAGSALAHPAFPDWGWWAAGGLVLADALHFLMDTFF